MKKVLIGILIIFILILSFITYKYFSIDSYITSEEARQIAMDDVSNKDDKYVFNSVEFKETHNNYIYTLEFSDSVNYYIYKINARTKKIISSKKELIDKSDVYMEEDKVLNKIFKNENLKLEDCNLISNNIVVEGDIPIYNTIFYYNNIKYVYKTNAYTGAIISVSKLNENAV